MISHFLSIQWVHQHRTTVQCSNEKVFVLTDFTEYIYYHLRVQMVFFSPRGCVTWRNLSVKDALSQVDMLLYERFFQGSALILCRYTKRI